MSTVNNGNLNTQNWRTFDTNSNFEARAKAIAQMAYGSGSREGDNGGKGNIGILGGKVLKFNTKWGERQALKKLSSDDADYLAMKDSCNNLRKELLAMAQDTFGEDKTEDLNKIRRELGFAETGDDIKDDAGLLKRTTVASVLKKLVKAHGDGISKLNDTLWDGAMPTWGSSVTSFLKEADEQHFANVDKMRKVSIGVIENVVKNLEGNETYADGIMKNIDKHLKDISDLFETTSRLMRGPVLTDLTEKKAFLKLKDLIDEQRKILKQDIAAVKAAAKKSDTDGVHKAFGKMDDNFESFLVKCSKEVVFSGKKNYPKFGTGREGVVGPVNEKIHRVVDDLQMTLRQSRLLTDKGLSVHKIALDWMKEYNENLNKLIVEFDGICGTPEKRKSFLENLKADLDNNKEDGKQNLNKIAALLVKMMDVTLHTEMEIDESDPGAKECTGNPLKKFVFLDSLDFTDIISQEVTDGLDAIKKLIMAPTSSQRKTIIFDLYNNGRTNNPAFPYFMTRESTYPSGKVDRILSNTYSAPGFLISLKFFERLYDVANALDLLKGDA